MEGWRSQRPQRVTRTRTPNVSESWNSRPRRTRSGRRGTARSIIDTRRFSTQNINMNTQNNLKHITLYVSSQLYEDYQFQAKKLGLSTIKLIHNALQAYADTHFKTKNSMEAIDFSRSVTLKAGATDFLTDYSWKSTLFPHGE